MPRNTKYQDLWSTTYPWVEPGHNATSAKCKICSSQIYVGSMGVTALKQHEAGKAHKVRIPTNMVNTNMYLHTNNTHNLRIFTLTLLLY